MKSKLATFVAAGILATGIAARAQAVAPDPNLAPTTSGEEARIAPTSPDSPQLAVAADPNLAPTTSAQETLIRPTSPEAPQLAVAPDPNLGEPSFVAMVNAASARARTVAKR